MNLNKMNMKEEKEDNREIQALADQIVERNRKRMIDRKQKSLPDTIKQPDGTLQRPKSPDGVINGIDEDSILKRFGWELIGRRPIPYLTRKGVKYCSVRMFEMNIINQYLDCLHEEVFECVDITVYDITINEIKLLNEINAYHCDFYFGKEPFNSRDMIFEMNDARNFYNFLGWCYMMIVNREMVEFKRGGFIRIGKESVPYIVRDDQRYAPIFFFEGDTNVLMQKAIVVSGWDFSYLQFLFKVQKVRKEHLQYDFCHTVNLMDIKHMFPAGILLEEYWPREEAACFLINTNHTRRQPVQWAKTEKALLSVINLEPPNGPKKQKVPLYSHTYPSTQLGSTAYASLRNVSERQLEFGHENRHKQQPSHSQTLQGQLTLVPIPEHADPKHISFKILHTVIYKEVFSSINMEPMEFEKLLVTLSDIVEAFFRNIPIQACARTMEIIGITLYKPNNVQKHILKKYCIYRGASEDIALVLAQDIQQYMPLLKRMLKNIRFY